jgi:transcriptional regulator with XRE-family HTH domain
MSNKLSNINQNFKSIRIANNFTQQQVADFLGIDRTLLAKFEAGERKLGVSVLEKACNLFGCTLADLNNSSEYTPIITSYNAILFTTEDMESLNLRDIKKENQ